MRINHRFTGGAKVTGREEYLKLRFCGVFSIEGMPVGWGGCWDGLGDGVGSRSSSARPGLVGVGYPQGC